MCVCVCVCVRARAMGETYMPWGTNGSQDNFVELSLSLYLYVGIFYQLRNLTGLLFCSFISVLKQGLTMEPRNSLGKTGWQRYRLTEILLPLSPKC